MNCRFCESALEHVFVDLGSTPLSNSYLNESQMHQMEPTYPLKVFVCTECWLVQIDEWERAENIFSHEYAYFSSYSSGWLKHSEEYVLMMKERFQLGPSTLALEVASNDGYLLQYFKQEGVPVLGVEPTANTASVAKKKGIPTEVNFFGARFARELKAKGVNPTVMLGNNVIAHVPDLNDFVLGFKILLNPEGVITFEFPHLMSLIQDCQFDTIYHEHFSYFSLITISQIMKEHGLSVFDVEKIKTHGGSLRVFVKHSESQSHELSPRVQALLDEEKAFGLDQIKTYQRFAYSVSRVKINLLKFLVQAAESGKKVVGYGAPAKGNTLLNYCGVTPDLLPYTVDLSEHKQGKFLPGTRIPIFNPQRILEDNPDYVLILPWNLKSEIVNQLTDLRKQGCRFVVPLPELTEV